jgi:hypothetical protein
MKIIGIVGSRSRTGNEVVNAIEDALLRIYDAKARDRVVSGGCPIGADRIAEQLAKKHQISITIHYAQWDLLGKGAGFIRNEFIAQDADILIASVAQNRKGGTENTIKHFLAKVKLDEAEAIRQGRLILV